MPNSYFQFRQFCVHQERCAMKVGTDGTLLGAWASGGIRVLDIGTGTGLIVLMMAQRYPEAMLTAVDIDPAAVAQAQENVTASPFANRISVLQADARILRVEPSTAANALLPFDAIVCNPPFFARSLTSPNPQRTVARHTTMLTFADLMSAAVRLLAADGELSVVIPDESRSAFMAEASLAGLFLSRQCSVRTTPHKQPRRWLLAFRRHSVDSVDMSNGIIEDAPGQRSAWYTALTSDFYLY